MKSFGKAGMILAKITEIVFWIGVISMVVAFALCLIKPAGFISLQEDTFASTDGTLQTMGLEVANIPADVNAFTTVLLWFAPAAAILMSLMAMIFRNLYLIMKKVHADKKEAFSETNSPFQPDIIRMVREIGIFALSIPIVELIANEVFYLAFRTAGLPVEIGGFSVTLLVFGLVILYLSSIFSYGGQLQQETEGLV